MRPGPVVRRCPGRSSGTAPRVPLTRTPLTPSTTLRSKRRRRHDPVQDRAVHGRDVASTRCSSIQSATWLPSVSGFSGAATLTTRHAGHGGAYAEQPSHVRRPCRSPIGAASWRAEKARSGPPDDAAPSPSSSSSSDTSRAPRSSASRSAGRNTVAIGLDHTSRHQRRPADESPGGARGIGTRGSAGSLRH
jgi:hypothetical protein